MTFQFLCPQGHLLEGDPAQAGQACDCPTCGTRFIIPAPQAEAEPETPAEEPNPFDFSAGSAPAGELPHLAADAGGDELPPLAGDLSTSTPGADLGMGLGSPELFHIPCPKGHVLETPFDMVGQEVLCPFCSTQFQLRHKDSLEFKRERDAELERLDRQAGAQWFNRAIVAAVVVLLGLIIMIAITVSGS